jgi:hypothetical protein
MMNLKIALVALSLAGSAFAQQQSDEALKIFKNSPQIKAEIEKVKANSITELQEGGVYTVPVGGGCGFAGCDETVLVIQVLEYNGTNPQWTSVKGLVSIPAFGDPTIQVVDLIEKTGN